MEIKLPTPGIDLRIPVSLRGSVNPSTSDKLEDRVDAELEQIGNQVRVNSIVYKSEWKYQVLLTAGAAAYF